DAFLLLAARIANHARAATDERNRPMPEPLQPRERHQRHQISDVKARRGGVETDVRGDLFLREQFRETVRHVVHEAAPRELIEDVRHEAIHYYTGDGGHTPR